MDLASKVHFILFWLSPFLAQSPPWCSSSCITTTTTASLLSVIVGARFPGHCSAERWRGHCNGRPCVDWQKTMASAMPWLLSKARWRGTRGHQNGPKLMSMERNKHSKRSPPPLVKRKRSFLKFHKASLVSTEYGFKKWVWSDLKKWVLLWKKLGTTPIQHITPAIYFGKHLTCSCFDLFSRLPRGLLYCKERFPCAFFARPEIQALLVSHDWTQRSLEMTLLVGWMLTLQLRFPMPLFKGSKVFFLLLQDQFKIAA